LEFVKMNKCKRCQKETCNRVFCSSSCSALYNGRKASDIKHQKSKEKYDLNKKSCSFCGKLLEYNDRRKKFCNHSCAASYNNLGVRRHGSSRKDCIRCGKEIKRNANKYCSRTCQHEYKYEKYIERWLNKEEDGLKGKCQMSARIKRWLTEQRGECCEFCGWNEVNPATGKTPIAADHIDGNYKNNRPENLRLLCPNCHSLTPTYGRLNIGNGRPDRKERRNRSI